MEFREIKIPTKVELKPEQTEEVIDKGKHIVDACVFDMTFIR